MQPEPQRPEATDRDLLCRHHGGEPGAFEALYARYARPLYFYLRSLSEDPPLSEDLLQETFLRLLERTPFQLEESVRGLVFTIARNLVRDEARKREVRERVLPALEIPNRREGEPPPEALARALQALPAEQREAVALKFYGELTFAEIAEVSGAPEPTVKSRYRYAIEKLSELLKESHL